MVFSISPSEICFFGCHLDKEIQLGSIVQTREHTKERREQIRHPGISGTAEHRITLDYGRGSCYRGRHVLDDPGL